MDQQPAAQPLAPEQVFHAYYHIGDGGLTVAIEKDREYGYPILVFKHGAWGHGSEIRVMPDAGLFAHLSEVFKLAAAQKWDKFYGIPARTPRPFATVSSGDAAATPAADASATPDEHAGPQG